MLYIYMVTKFLNNIFPNFKVHVSQFLYVHQRRSKNVWSFQICKMAIMINCVSSKKALLMNKNLLKYQTVFQWKYPVQILPLFVNFVQRVFEELADFILKRLARAFHHLCQFWRKCEIQIYFFPMNVLWTVLSRSAWKIKTLYDSRKFSAH